HLPVPALRYYGCVEDPDGRSSWLFLEDAGEEKYMPLSEMHRALAARWLGLVHVATARRAPLASLPDRVAAHYQEHLRSARDAVLGHLASPISRTRDTTILRGILLQCDSLAGRWNWVEEACAGMPETLVHGDFTKKNLRVRTSPGELTLLTFDWETAGR